MGKNSQLIWGRGVTAEFKLQWVKTLGSTRVKINRNNKKYVKGKKVLRTYIKDLCDGRLFKLEYIN